MWINGMRVGLAMLMATVVVSTAAAQSMDELQERFKERYPALMQLKGDGLVGEVHDGLVDVVRAEFRARPADSNRNVGQFIDEENTDRRRLYQLIAQQQRTSADRVADRAAKRNFERARPEDYLKPESGVWVQKKDYRE